MRSTVNCFSNNTPQILQKPAVQIAIGAIALIIIAYIAKSVFQSSQHNNDRATGTSKKGILKTLPDPSVHILLSMNDSQQPSYTITTQEGMEACNAKMQLLWQGLQKPGDGQYLGHGNLYDEARKQIKFDLIRTHYVGDADESDGLYPDVHAPIVDGVTVILTVALKIFGNQAVTFSLNDTALSFLQNSEWVDASKQDKPEIELHDPTYAYSQKILQAWNQAQPSAEKLVSGALMYQQLETCYVNDKARNPISELYSDGKEKLISNYYIPLDDMLKHLTSI